MLSYFTDLFSANYIPKGECFQWNEGILWTDVISDILISVVHFSIAVLVVIFLQKRKDVHFSWKFLFFISLFNVLLGIIHLLNIVTIWQPIYLLEALIRIIAAVTAIGTVLLFIPIFPYVLRIPNPRRLQKLNEELQNSLNENEKTQQENQMLINLTLAITTARDIKEAFYTTIKKICETTRWDYGDAWLYNQDTDKMEFAGNFITKDDASLKQFGEISANVFFGKGEGLPGKSWASKNSIWENNISNIKYLPRRKAAEMAGIKTALAIPIPLDDEVIAILCFYMTNLKKEDDQFERLITAVAGQLGLVLKRKKLEDAQKESELKFRSLTESSPDAIFLADSDGKIVFVNKGVEKIFGYRQEELIQQKVTAIMPERYRKAHEEGIKRYLATKVPHVIGTTISVEGLRKDGTEFPIELSVGTWSSKQEIFFSGIIRDITERKMVEKELIQKNKELELSNTELERFAFVASHDMKEPLRMVSNYTQLLEKRFGDELGTEGKQYITYAVDGVYRIQTLINDLLEYAKIGQANLLFKETDCTLAARQAVTNLKAMIQDTNATVNIDELPVIVAIPSQIVQLFQNLINNAIKFRGEEPPVITIKARKAETNWVFSVKDNGIGIDEQYADKIFVLFQRIHTWNEYPGTGIGLSICKKIVEIHGGNIWFESEEGKGSTFIFSLPQIPAPVNKLSE